MTRKSSIQFNVSHAVVRGLPSTFEEALSLEPPPEPISVAIAHAQHLSYTELLRKIVPNVVELPADDTCPDCVFIEDTALIINELLAVISRPGAASRQPEPAPVAALLREHLRFPRVETLQPPATLDGGDVQVLPWAVLVGLSRRTNKEAVAQLSALLRQAGGPPVFEFSVLDAEAAAAAEKGAAAGAGGEGAPRSGGGSGGGTLHFKSVLSALDPRTLLVADTPVGRALADQIRSVPELQSPALELIFLPDSIAANVLSAGEHVVMQEGFPASEAIVRQLCTERGLTLHTLRMSELAKADGALTCCSLLFAAPPVLPAAAADAAAAAIAAAKAADAARAAAVAAADAAAAAAKAAEAAAVAAARASGAAAPLTPTQGTAVASGVMAEGATSATEAATTAAGIATEAAAIIKRALTETVEKVTATSQTAAATLGHAAAAMVDSGSEVVSKLRGAAAAVAGVGSEVGPKATEAEAANEADGAGVGGAAAAAAAAVAAVKASEEAAGVAARASEAAAVATEAAGKAAEAATGAAEEAQEAAAAPDE